MDTKICINPTCKNVLLTEDIFCNRCGSEQPRQMPQIAENIPEAASNNFDPWGPVQATPSASSPSRSMEEIPERKKPPTTMHPMPEITPTAPPADLIGRSCPVCLTDLYHSDDSSREMVIECPACHSYHHQKCWEINQGCSTYGCKWTPSADVQADNTAVPAPGETYRENPIARTETAQHVSRKGKGMAFLANLELVFGLMPFLAPVGLFCGIAVVAFNRKGLQEMYPSHRMRFWVGFIASCVIMLLFLFTGMIYLLY